MTNEFREVEESFSRLKESYNEGRISQREFIDSLKQLRIKDDKGRFWMIGAQTGKWYYFDGNDWVPAKPPSIQDHKAICIYCGFENDLEAEICVRCGSRKPEEAEPPVCPKCGARLEKEGAPCPSCGPAPVRAEAAALAGASPAGASPVAASEHPATAAGRRVFSAAAPREGIVVRSVHAVSFFWFSGVLGLFAGIVFGLAVGATSFFPGFVAGLPSFFQRIQGNIIGGAVFTITGGILGFVVLGGAGLAVACVLNGVLSLIGGLRFETGSAAPAAKEEERPVSSGPFS